MAYTTYLVSAHLLRPLAEVIMSYFSTDPYGSGLTGLWESASQWEEPEMYSAMAGAIDGAYDELKGYLLGTDRQDWERIATHACANGHLALLRMAIAHGVDNIWYGMHKASRNGHLNIVEAFLYPEIIRKNSYSIHNISRVRWNSCLYQACRGGHVDIAKLLIARGADDINLAMSYACRGGQREIVELMIANGASDWDMGLIHACRGGHVDIIETMIAKGANVWDRAMASACRRNQFNVVKMMIARGANDWNYGLHMACRGNHVKLAEFMIAQGASNLEYMMRLVCELGRVKMFPVLAAAGVTTCLYCERDMDDHLAQLKNQRKN